jgi:hypothetical protein
MFLGSLKIGNVEAKVAERPGRANDRPLAVPTLLFGNNKTLAPKESGNYADSIRDYGRQRLRLLDDSRADSSNSPLLHDNISSFQKAFTTVAVHSSCSILRRR